MEKISLNGAWTVSGGEFINIESNVPGCIHTDLLDNGLIDDPYYRDNEERQMWIGTTDWAYERSFDIDRAFLSHKHIQLVCNGLDTFAAITINGNEIAKTDNMFRTWEFEIKKYLKAGKNTIQIKFLSTYPYMKEKVEERWLKITDVGGCREIGGNYVRKMQCNYGWDWGPKCVTAGIWRDIELQAYDVAKIGDVHITQKHSDHCVELQIKTNLKDYSGEKLKAITIVSFDGKEIHSSKYEIDSKALSCKIIIDDPKLWWPNNMGKQNLYDVKVKLIDKGEKAIDEKQTRIGLRTLTLDRHDDEWGESFQFKVNEAPFFAKGANWIPIDTFITRGSDEFYRQLLTDAKEANMNFVRVWGGGIYEEDIFFNLCDELGLCVWQDFMFACSAYPVYDKAWLDTFKQEAADNIKRLRSHPCMALWCGNNEIEMMDYMISDEIDKKEGTMTWKEYKLLFENIISSTVRELDGEHDYWVTSPYTPGENRRSPNDPTKGDAHLWGVWHGRKPFEWYRTCEHRFNSEFGFQSFPEPEVVKSYTLPEDRNITSYVMEKHQRSHVGNEAILQYMLSWFQLPKNFDMLMWTSQILQSLAVKYAVEHCRRKMPQGMGTLYWQINDCWPVASWSSIDYIGNWKALHYIAKKFFNPILISGVEDKEKLTVEVYLSNDTLEERRGKVQWTLMNLNGKLEAKDTFEATIAANSSAKVKKLDLSEVAGKAGGIRDVVLFYSFIVDGKELSSNTTYFERPKHMKLQIPNFETDIKRISKKKYELTIKSDKPALWVWPDIEGVTAKYSDRFFDLDGKDEKTIMINLEKDTEISAVEKRMVISSIIDTYN